VDNGYTTLLASDVLDRNGLGMELYDPSDQLVAEVFRDDDSGSITVRFMTQESLRISLVEEFIAAASKALLN
jgi:hypothetical protein